MVSKNIRIFTFRAEISSFQELFQEKAYQIQEKAPFSPSAMKTKKTKRKLEENSVKSPRKSRIKKSANFKEKNEL
jgi:hypothetical protein